jgi:hypothetical protein
VGFVRLLIQTGFRKKALTNSSLQWRPVVFFDVGTGSLNSALGERWLQRIKQDVTPNPVPRVDSLTENARSITLTPIINNRKALL